MTQLIQLEEGGGSVAGDTQKVKEMVNSVACKALHLYKVIWQYLWLHKPADLFNGENAFIVDAHYFFQQIVDTLVYLPHVNDLERVLDVSDQCKIVMKSLEILIFLTREQEFADFFKREGINLYL